MLQHVALEIAPDLVEDAAGFWHLLGFERVPEPEPLAGKVTWFEREGTQIHLLHTDGAVAPVLGHTAVVVEDFEAKLGAVAAAGHEAFETRELWGARRAFVVGPGGHRVELMAAAPPRSR